MISKLKCKYHPRSYTFGELNMKDDHTDYICYRCGKLIKAYEVCSCPFFPTPESYKSGRIIIKRESEGEIKNEIS